MKDCSSKTAQQIWIKVNSNEEEINLNELIKNRAITI